MDKIFNKLDSIPREFVRVIMISEDFQLIFRNTDDDEYGLYIYRLRGPYVMQQHGIYICGECFDPDEIIAIIFINEDDADLIINKAQDIIDADIEEGDYLYSAREFLKG